MRIQKRDKRTIKQGELAQQLAGYIVKSQQRLANYLNQSTENLSGKSLRAVLILFCGVFGGYCLYLLITSTLSY